MLLSVRIQNVHILGFTLTYALTLQPPGQATFLNLNLFAHLCLRYIIFNLCKTKYRIVASTNTIQKIRSFTVSNSNTPIFFRKKTFLFLIRSLKIWGLLDKHMMCLSSSQNI